MEFIHRQSLREYEVDVRCSVSSEPVNSTSTAFCLHHVYVYSDLGPRGTR